MKEHEHPFNIDGCGRTARTYDYSEHIKQLVEQVLFTTAGERVNRPTFGSGINQLVFSPNSSEIATATQFLIQGALQQWLGEIIHVQSVTSQSRESQLHIIIHYTIKRNNRNQTVNFVREV